MPPLSIWKNFLAKLKQKYPNIQIVGEKEELLEKDSIIETEDFISKVSCGYSNWQHGLSVLAFGGTLTDNEKNDLLEYIENKYSVYVDKNKLEKAKFSKEYFNKKDAEFRKLFAGTSNFDQQLIKYNKVLEKDCLKIENFFFFLRYLTMDEKNTPNFTPSDVQVLARDILDLKQQRFNVTNTGYPKRWILMEIYKQTCGLFKETKAESPVKIDFNKVGLKDDFHSRLVRLTNLIENYLKDYSSNPSYSNFTKFCKNWLSDCYFLLGQYEKALNLLPSVDYFKQDFNNEKRFVLKELLHKNIDAYDLLTAGIQSKSTSYTEYATKNKKTFIDSIDNYLHDLYKKSPQTLDGFYNSKSKSGKYYLFNNASGVSNLIGQPMIWFYVNTSLVNYPKQSISDIFRNSENILRVSNGLPKIGEGWISETELYHFIKDSFPQYEVIHSYKSNWLGSQHLDIFIPKLCIGIEYQGEQHFEPIKRFGGEVKFEENKKRDLQKKEKCKRNNVTLLEVTKDYNSNNLLNKIKEIAKNKA